MAEEERLWMKISGYKRCKIPRKLYYFPTHWTQSGASADDSSAALLELIACCCDCCCWLSWPPRNNKGSLLARRGGVFICAAAAPSGEGVVNWYFYWRCKINIHEGKVYILLALDWEWTKIKHWLLDWDSQPFYPSSSFDWISKRKRDGDGDRVSMASGWKDGGGVVSLGFVTLLPQSTTIFSTRGLVSEAVC